MKVKAMALCGVSMLVLAGAAKAQSADEPGGGAVKEIVVTAQRRAERLQDVPITITNLNANQLKDVNATALSSIQQLTPALRVDFIGADGTQVTIRGVGTDLIGAGTGSDVGIYVDGFYQANLVGADFQLLNVQNVDVLKGPQGTLFGRNTSAGAIQITTSKPSHTDNLILDGQYGSYNAAQVSFYGTAGLSDKVAVDLAATYARGDGWLTNIVDNNHRIGQYEKWTIRPGILIDFTQDFSLLFRYEHSYNSDPNVDLYNSPVVGGIPQTIGFFIPGNLTTTDPRKVSWSNLLPASQLYRTLGTTNNFQLTLTDDLHFATIRSLTQYHTDNNNNASSLGATGPIEPFHTITITQERLITQEFLLSSEGAGPLQYTAGVFYLDFKSIGNSFGAGGPVSVAVDANNPLNDPFFVGGSGAEYFSYAVYGDVTYRVLDWLYLTGGLRFTHDDARNAFNQNLQHGRGPDPDLSSDNVTPRAVVRIEPDKSNSFYFSYSQGYKAGFPALVGDRLAAAAQGPVQPEKLTAYEIGYKHSQGPFRLDLSAYYYDWKNMQVSTLVTVEGNQAVETINAAAATVYGVEGQFYYAVTPNFSVNVGGAYTHGRFDSFEKAPGFVMCLDFLACGPAFGLQLNTPVNAKGFQLPRSPDFTATVGARYTHELAGGEFALSGNLYYTSKFYFDPVQAYGQNAYATLSLRAAWTDPSKRYTFAVFGDNVTDTKYRNQVLESRLSIEQAWAAPATVGVSVRVNLK